MKKSEILLPKLYPAERKQNVTMRFPTILNLSLPWLPDVCDQDVCDPDVCDLDVCDHLFVTKTFVNRTFVTILRTDICDQD